MTEPSTTTPPASQPVAIGSYTISKETVDGLVKAIPLGLVGVHNTILTVANAITGSNTTSCTLGEMIGFSIIFPLLLIFSGILGYNQSKNAKWLLCFISIFAYATYLLTTHSQPLICWINQSGISFNQNDLDVSQACILIGLAFIIGYLYTNVYQKKRKYRSNSKAQYSLKNFDYIVNI